MGLDAFDAADHFDRVDDIGYRLYRRLVDSDGDFVASVERALTQAAIAEPVEMYLSRGLALGLLGGSVAWVLAFAMSTLVASWPAGVVAIVEQTVWLIAVSGVVGGLGFCVAFGAYLARPFHLASQREREIDILLPDAISYMYALSTGKFNEVEIIEAMAAADDTYGEVAREFQRIVTGSEYFDIDYRTAIREQALVTPSDALGEFLTDMLSIINSGGDMVDFLDDKKEKHMRTAHRQQEETLDTLELFGELYIALSLFPLLLIIVLVIMGLMGTRKVDLLYATVYGLIPAGNLGFLILVAMVKRDDPGDGVISTENGTSPRREESNRVVRPETAELSATGAELFERLERGERRHRAIGWLTRPHVFLRERPSASSR